MKSSNYTLVSIIFQMREYVQSIFLKNPQDVCAHVPCGFGAHRAQGVDGLAMFSIAVRAANYWATGWCVEKMVCLLRFAPQAWARSKGNAHAHALHERQRGRKLKPPKRVSNFKRLLSVWALNVF